MARTVTWRLHCRSSPAILFDLLTSDAGRERFWAERCISDGDCFLLLFPDGTEERCRMLRTDHPSRILFRYFNSDVEILLEPDGSGGTDLTLTNSGIAEEEYQEVHAG